MKSLLPLTLLVGAPALAADPSAELAGTRLDISATGVVQRVPDVAIIATGVMTQAASPTEAMAANARRMTATVAALRGAGVADRDIQTQTIALNPQYRYGDNVPPTLTGYQASNRVSVRLRDLKRVGTVLDALVKAGANQIDGPSFELDQPEPALDEARTKAVGMARARAELYARAAGLRVGRIVRISESDAAPPVVRPMAVMAMRKGAADTPVESGEQNLAVTVSVTFELN